MLYLVETKLAFCIYGCTRTGEAVLDAVLFEVMRAVGLRREALHVDAYVFRKEATETVFRPDLVLPQGEKDNI